MSTKNNKIFLDLDKTLPVVNSSKISPKVSPTRLNSSLNSNHSNKINNSNNNANLIFSNCSTLYSNSNGYHNGAKRTSTSPRSTSSYNSTYTGSLITNSTYSLTTTTIGSSSNSSCSTRSLSSCTSMPASCSSFSNSQTNATDTLCDNNSNLSSCSSHISSGHSQSVSSNDDDKTTSKRKRTPIKSTYSPYSYNKDDEKKSYSFSQSNSSSSSESSFYTSHSGNSVEYINTSCSSFSPSPVATARKSVKPEPANTNDDPSLKLKCQWERCRFTGKSIDGEGDDSLVNHLKTKHIKTQIPKSTSKVTPEYKCLWKGCKSYAVKSVSFTFLERHVIDHIDTKPIQCLFKDTCKKKFRTVQELDKHVQSHYTNAASFSPHVSPQKNSKELFRNLIEKANKDQAAAAETIETKINAVASIAQANGENNKTLNLLGAVASGADVTKLSDCYAQMKSVLMKRKKSQKNNSQLKKFKKIQYEDFIDNCAVNLMDKHRQMLKYDSRAGTISFDCNVIGLRTEGDLQHVLIEWLPIQIVADEWIERSLLGCRMAQMRCLSIKDIRHLDLVNSKTNPFYRNISYRTK